MPWKIAYQSVLEEKAVIIDVREEHELKESGMAEGALWMPTSKMDCGNPEWSKFKTELPKNKLIYLYCKSGVRSGRVCDCLAMEGYQTTNLGGFKDWLAASLPVKKIS